MRTINQQSIDNYLRIQMSQNPIPTPFVSEEIVPLIKGKIGLCGTAVEVENIRFVSNYLPFDCQICGQNAITGTTNYDLSPVVSFRTKSYSTEKPYTPLQRKCIAENQFNVLDEIALSQQQGWDAMLEHLIIYGSPLEGVNGFLWGSGIPQLIDSNNFYNNSLTGTQMVTIFTNWVASIGQINGYAYVAGSVIIPISLATIFSNTNYNTQTSESVLDVLINRLQKMPGGAVKLAQASSLNDSRAIIILPSDPEAIQIHVTDYMSLADDRSLAAAAATSGVVAVIPSTALVVRLA